MTGGGSGPARPAAEPVAVSGPVALGRGLLLSCHPLPTVAVTALSAGLAVLAGVPLGSGVLLVLAVLTGQLSIGWSNDRIDAARDRAVHRSDKPVAAGAVPLRAVTVAAAVALVATIGFSAWLGWRPGLAALTVVICGWAYNLGLKATVVSFLPYALAFGMLPAVATLAAVPPAWPAAWALAAGSLLGVAAHLANVLPDLTADAETGVRGFPHRLGARGTAVATPVLLALATVIIVLAPGGSGGSHPVPAWKWVATAAVLMVAVIAAVDGYRRPTGRLLFLGAIVVAAADLLLFALSGGVLT